MLRVCRKCNQEKSLDEFVPNPRCREGRTHRCKDCANANQRKLLLVRRPLESRPREINKQLREQGLKKCSKCHEIKPLDDFHRGQAVRWGKHGVSAYCKPCASIRNQQYRRDHRERLEEYNKQYRERADIVARRDAHRKVRAAKTPRGVMQITLRHGLNRKPTEFPATIDDLMEMFNAQGGRCAVSGIELTWALGKVTATSISLDRINPEGGYSKDNLRIVCQAVNAFKGQMSDEEMVEMARAIVACYDDKSDEPTWLSPTFGGDIMITRKRPVVSAPTYWIMRS